MQPGRQSAFFRATARPEFSVVFRPSARPVFLVFSSALPNCRRFHNRARHRQPTLETKKTSHYAGARCHSSATSLGFRLFARACVRTSLLTLCTYTADSKLVGPFNKLATPPPPFKEDFDATFFLRTIGRSRATFCVHRTLTFKSGLIDRQATAHCDCAVNTTTE